jgi:transcriptional regulator with XRE-family HTH domain
MMESLGDDREELRLFEQGRAIMDVTELICEIMEDQGVSRSELAERLETSKSNVTQTLDGTRNMTVRKISDILFELGHSLKVDVLQPERIGTRRLGKTMWCRTHPPGENKAWEDCSCRIKSKQEIQRGEQVFVQSRRTTERDFKIAS